MIHMSICNLFSFHYCQSRSEGSQILNFLNLGGNEKWISVLKMSSNWVFSISDWLLSRPFRPEPISVSMATCLHAKSIELGPRYHLYFKTYSRWGNSKAVSHALRNRIYTYGSSFLPQLITKNLLVIFAMSLANQNPSKYSKL